MQPTSQQSSRVPAVMLFGVWFCASIVCHDLSAAPVCALLDTTKLPVVAILEARLLADAKATWVERTEINRVLGEQELQAAFGAEGVKQRSSLGQLLKADILILLRPAKNPDEKGPPLIDCVVCETKRGLRLRMLTVVSDKNAEETAGALEGLIQQGLKKYAEKIESVVAVPPFLSEDLSLEFNYLQSAYAKLVEERLLEQPGLLVIELKEAQAIAKELALDQRDGTLQKSKPPLYVMGRFRHDGVGAERTMRMSLRLLEGEKQLALKGVKDLTTGEAPAWISRKTTDILPLIREGSTSTEAFSAQVEAKRLAERGRQFQKVGSWQEALELFEASLLLDPDQIEIRARAVASTVQFILSLNHPNRSFEEVETMLALYGRGLEHQEIFLKSVKSIDSYREFGSHPLLYVMGLEWPIISRPHRFGGTVLNKGPPESPLRKILDQAQLRHTETYLRIARFRADLKIFNDVNCAAKAVDGFEWNEQLVAAYRLITEQRNDSVMVGFAEDMLFLGNWKVPQRSYLQPEFDTFLVNIKKVENESARQLAVRMERRVAQISARIATDKERKPVELPTDYEPAIKSVPIKFPPSRVAGDFVREGTVAKDRSFVCTLRSLYDLNNTGGLKAFIPDLGIERLTFTTICDGQYIWQLRRMLTQSAKCELIAIDLATQKIHEFAAADGLPEFDGAKGGGLLAPLENGRIFICGYNDRTWAGTAEIAPNGTKKVDVFFTARQMIDEKVADQPSNLNLSFQPSFVTVSTLAVGRDRLALLGRDSHSRGITDRPLVLNLDRKTARLADFEMQSGIGHGQSLSIDGTFFFIDSDRSNSKLTMNLSRIQYPYKQLEVLTASCPEGYLAADSRGLQIIGKEWWLVDPSSGAVRSAAGKTLWFFGNLVQSREEHLKYNLVDYAKTALLEGAIPTANFGVLAYAVRREPTREHFFWQLNLTTPTPAKSGESR